MKKALFLLLVWADNFRYKLFGNVNWCDALMERANIALWPDYDGEGFRDLVYGK